MIEVIGWLFMVMIVSIVPVFFGCVIVSIINEAKRRKRDERLKESAKKLLNYYSGSNRAENDDETYICRQCNGSGEGMYDGTYCSLCKGTGEEREYDEK